MYRSPAGQFVEEHYGTFQGDIVAGFADSKFNRSKMDRQVYGTRPDMSKMKTINILREQVFSSNEYKESMDECQMYLTEYTFHRFLCARKYNVDKAFALLKDHLNWRYQLYKPFNIKSNDVEVYARRGAIQSSPRGLDKHGRPVLILDDTKANVNISDSKIKQREAMKHLVFHVERCIACFDDNVKKFVAFVNLEDFKLRSAPSISTIKETANIFANQYPETLGLVVFYKPPWIFQQFFNAVKLFFDQETRKKIIFISGKCHKGSKNDIKLCNLIGDNWRELTGMGLAKKESSLARGYDHEEIWSQIQLQESLTVGC